MTTADVNCSVQTDYQKLYGMFEQFKIDNDARFSKSEATTDEKISKVAEQAKINQLISSYEHAQDINSRLTVSQVKIGGLNAGLVTAGLILTCIPPVTLIGVGVLASSGISGVGSHFILQGEKQELNKDQILGKLLMDNPGKSLAEVTKARDEFDKWAQEEYENQSCAFEGKIDYPWDWNGINVRFLHPSKI